MVMRWWRMTAALLIVVLLTSGCMYRSEIERQQANPAFIREEIGRVASAVDRYYEARGVYPIKNSDESTSVYEKYVLDLNKLVQVGMLSQIPGNAFENGGTYYYLLIHPETDPVVMLMDLVAMQQTADLQKKVDEYKAKNNGDLPLGTETSPGFYTIDYGTLGSAPVQLRSAFTNQYLPLLLHESGEVLIDYSLDIVEAARHAGDQTAIAEGEDAREWLVKASPLSPVRSYPYEWTNGEPKLVSPGQ